MNEKLQHRMIAVLFQYRAPCIETEIFYYYTIQLELLLLLGQVHRIHQQHRMVLYLL